ncbi:MAG TPA: hypothetical protein P5266_07835 [Candidatus Fermentibacter sp.]|nr:hypothetical protein [Candidatus Fermentibacter sp.]
MKTLKLKFDDEMAERLSRVAAMVGYSSPEELALHVLSRELDKLDPGTGESEEDLKRKLKGLGYMA